MGCKTLTVYKILIKSKFKGEKQWINHIYRISKDDIGSVMRLFLKWVNGKPLTAKLLKRKVVNNQVIIILKGKDRQVEIRKYSIISENRIEIKKYIIKKV